MKKIQYLLPREHQFAHDYSGFWRRSGYESGGGNGLVCNPTFPAGGLGGAVSPPAGCRTHFGKNLLQINLKSGLFSVAVYTPNSDPISDVHWLVRRKIGSAVHGCAKLVDIRMLNIENDRLVKSLVYCAIYAQLLVLRALGGASYRTGIILVVFRMAAPPATTSSELAHLDH